MDRYKVLKTFLTVSVLSCLCHGWKVVVEKSVTAVEGSCVMLPCKTSSHSSVIWYKYKSMGYPIVYSKNTADVMEQFKGRTSVPGNLAEGNCTLKIDNIRRDDGGVEVYAWINPETTSQRFYDQTTTINVVSPRVLISMEESQVEGNLFSANCTVQHSCPSSPPPLDWEGLPHVSNTVTITVDKNGLWTSVAHAKVKANQQDHGKSLRCKSTLSNKSIQSQAVQLNVLYPPKAVSIDGAELVDVTEGSAVSLTCQSSSNPPPTEYEWLVTDRTPVKQKEQKTYYLQNIKRNTSVSCIAHNSLGQGQSKEILLNVHYPATVMRDSKCLEGPEGLRCVCRADSEPEANISWKFNGSSTILPQFKTMTKYVGGMTVSELLGPLTHNVFCEASNYLGTDIYQIPIQHLQSAGNFRWILVGVCVSVCVVFGIALAAVCILKRSRRVRSENDVKKHNTTNLVIKQNIYKRDIVSGSIYTNDGIYGNDTAGDDIYANTAETPPMNKEDDLYENF